MFYILHSTVAEQLAQDKEKSLECILSTSKTPLTLFVDDDLTKLVRLINADISLKGAVIAIDSFNGLRIMWELYDQRIDRWMDNKKYTAKSIEKNEQLNIDYAKKECVQIQAIKFDKNNEEKSFAIVNECLANYKEAKISQIVSDDRGQIHYIIISHITN